MKKASLFCLGLLLGCEENKTAQVSANYLLNTNDFNLETVTALFKANKVSDLESLEKEINNPENGINNVDIDKDGKIDYVAAHETINGSSRTIEFVAYPSSKNGNDATTVATVNVTQSNNEVSVQSGYPDHVAGHDNVYYHYTVPMGPTFSEMLLLSWMMSPRPVYYHPYAHYAPLYVSHPVLAPNVILSKKTTYYNTTKVSPIVKSTTPPPSYKPVTGKVPSGYVSPSKANGIGGAGGTKSYSTPNKSPAPASGFGGKPSTPTYKPSAPTYKPSTPSFKGGKK